MSNSQEFVCLYKHSTFFFSASGKLLANNDDSEDDLDGVDFDALEAGE